MALKNEKTYCGNGFPNLPDFKDLSGGGSGSAAVLAGQAIRISDISVSNVSYKRVNASVDDLTIAVDGVTNKLKSLVKGVKDYSTDEVDTGMKWIDGKEIYQRTFDLGSDITINAGAWYDTAFKPSETGVYNIINISTVVNSQTDMNCWGGFGAVANKTSDKISLLNMRGSSTATVRYFTLQYVKNS